MANGPYSRLYHAMMDEYPSVFRDDAKLGAFVRLLILAEKFYPQNAPLPVRDTALKALVRCGLVVVSRDRRSYTIKGLRAERERRSTPGRIAAAARWQSDRIANAMPDETRREKKEKVGANAPRSHDGQHRNCAVCDAGRAA